MRLRRVLVGLAALAAVALGGVIAVAVVAALTVNPDDYRDDIAGALESATGRKVTLGGPLELSISLSPALVVHDVSIANVAWGSRPQMATIRQLDLEVALLPLIDGVLHVHSLRLEGADVLLETGGDGKANWVFGADQQPAGAATTDGEVRIDSLEVVDSTLAYLDGDNGNRRQLDISSATLEAASPDSEMTIDASAKVDGAAVSISGTLDSLASLRAGKDTAIDLTVTAPNIDLTAKGALGGIASGGDSDLQVALDIASLGLFHDLGLIDLPLEGPLKLSTHVTGTAHKMTFGDLRVEGAGTTLTGNLTADIAGERPAFSGKLEADAIDLATWAPGGEGTGDSEKLFPDDPLRLHLLDAVDADVDLAIGALTTGNLVFRDVRASVKLKDADLAVSPFSLGVAGSSVDGALALDGARSPPAASLQLSSKGFDMGALLKQSNVTEALTGKADIDVDVSGQGDSIAAIMAALGGKASFVMTDGSVSESGLDLFLGGARALIGGLFEKDSGSARLSCLAAAWDVKGGIATQSVLLADTQYSTLTGKGQIDLGKETIDETLTPNAKGVSLSLAVPVDIGGTLMHPTVTPDEGALAVKVGSLIGSFFFPPAALLGLSDLGIGADHPCVTANDGAEAQSQGISTGGVVDDAGKIVDDAAGAVGSTIEDVGKGLDSLFGN